MIFSTNTVAKLLALSLCYYAFSQVAYAEVYLGKKLDKGIPANENKDTFNCNGKLYGVVVGKWPAGSKHQMEAYWTDPQGKQREHTKYTFIARKGDTHIWAWLQLHEGKTDLFDRMLMQENDSMREFDGNWKVNFYVDDKSQGELRFRLICG